MAPASFPAPERLHETVPARLLLERGAFAGDVDAVVPCYRSGRHLPRLLQSLFDPRCAVPGERINLHLVIDGDGYDPRGAVARFVPPAVGVRIVTLESNTGYAHATNIGADGARAPYLLLLNADVRIPLPSGRPGWLAPGDFLSPLCAALANDARAGGAGGLQLDPAGRIHSCGSEYDPVTRGYEHVLREGAARLDVPYQRRGGERDALTASCLLLSRRVWNAAGGLDEGYRIGYFEDIDLCLRIRRMGYRLRYVPASVVVHDDGHAGCGGHAGYESNRERLLRRWVETGEAACLARERVRRDPSLRPFVPLVRDGEEAIR